MAGAQQVVNFVVVVVEISLWANASASCHFLFLISPKDFLVQDGFPSPPSLATSGVSSTASEHHLYALNDQMFSVAPFLRN